VAALIAQERTRLQAQGLQLLATGGVLYADAGRQQATRESVVVGAGSVIGIVLVLLLALRSWRALLAFTAVACGLLAGFVACVAIFGTIHVLTLVVGTSLIGIAIDFPMHWMGKSFGMTNWKAWPALWRVLPGLSISLAANLVGYLALAFTPFPGLMQIAVFSSAGVLGAYACTVCLLPAWSQRWQPRPALAVMHFARLWLAARDALLHRRTVRYGGIALLLVACTGGVLRLNMQDDLRQWLGVPPALLEQAAAIGTITGYMPTSQFFLVRGRDEAELLERQAQVAQALNELKTQGRLASYLALSQIATPVAAQRQTQERLAQYANDPAPWQAFAALGIPVSVIADEARSLSQLPVLDLDQVLALGPLENWRSLWLGMHDDSVAALITLQGLSSTDKLAAIAASVPGVTLIDQSGALNRMFTATRIKAAELKLASYLLAGGLLWLTLGKSAAWRILTVPLVATLCTLATMGYLGQTLTLFSLFGLLLVSAIGADYAIIMYEKVAGEAASFCGVLLAGGVTLLSFGLLSFSHTPAISSFGLAVALGIGFCVLLAPWAAFLPESARRS
jgi:predicted exporter